MDSRRCAACGAAFRPRPQTPEQCYCSAKACQRERRRNWQLAKHRSDTDYRENQARAQRAWCERNPDYWRDYRQAHPEYLERNRARQRDRNSRQRERVIAKMDASQPNFPLPSGIYRISPAPPIGIAKIDAWTVEITRLSAAYREPVESCKERTS